MKTCLKKTEERKNERTKRPFCSLVLKFFSSSVQREARGFSLIELLVVISIIGILAALTVPSFNTFNRRQTVKQAAKQLRADLRLTQNRAVSSIDNSAWGISSYAVGSTSYRISKFEDDTNPNIWTEVSGSAKTISLPSGIAFSTVPTTDPTVFERLTGISTNAPETPLVASACISVGWASGSSTTQIVSISPEGNIEEVSTCTAPPPPPPGPGSIDGITFIFIGGSLQRYGFADVSLYKDGALVAATTSNGWGYYQLTNVEPCTNCYTVTGRVFVSPYWYSDTRANWTVASGQNTRVSLLLLVE